MNTSESPQSSGNYLRRNIAVGLAVGAAMLAGNEVVREPAPAEAEIEQIANRDPIFEHTDQQNKLIVKKMQILIKHDVPGTYLDKEVEIKGKQLTRLVVAVKDAGRSTYTQLVAYIEPGKTLPVSTATVYGAPRARFQVQNQQNEPFNRLVTWIGNDRKKNDYLIMDTARAGGGWINKFYEKDGSKNTFWLNYGPKKQISYQKMAARFNSLTTEEARILSFAGKRLPQK